MSGYPECDGILAVNRNDEFSDVESVREELPRRTLDPVGRCRPHSGPALGQQRETLYRRVNQRSRRATK